MRITRLFVPTGIRIPVKAAERIPITLDESDTVRMEGDAIGVTIVVRDGDGTRLSGAYFVPWAQVATARLATDGEYSLYAQDAMRWAHDPLGVPTPPSADLPGDTDGMGNAAFPKVPSARRKR